MIYLELFLAFLKVGCFSFGGYAAIPIVRDTVLAHAWMDETKFAELLAVSESTPGPIMVNMATFVGSEQGGFLGAVIATLSVVLPAFLIVLLLMKVMQHAINKPAVQAGVNGIKPAAVGLIFATGVYMLIHNVFSFAPFTADVPALCLSAALAVVYFGAKKVFKNGISPIVFIFIAGVAGVALYGAV